MNKFLELIVYISLRSDSDPHFGKVKLNKLLFYSDFTAYARLGRSISGQEYVKQPYGPVPRDIGAALESLEGSQSVCLVPRTHFQHTQFRVLARREPDLSAFTGDEIAVVNEVLTELRDLNASDTSERSHEFIGWRLAEMSETIPYETMLLSDEPPSEDDLAFGRALLAGLPR